MEAIKALLTRHAVREFEIGEKVGEKELDAIVRAALQAPSARDIRPVHLIVIRDRQKLDTLAARMPYAKMCSTAPLAILVCGDESKTKMDYIATDCSAAALSILLAAHAQGLGAVWTAVYPGPERVGAIREELGVPEGIIPLALIPIGYPGKGADSKPKKKYDAARIHQEKW
jgi:nitroreductase